MEEKNKNKMFFFHQSWNNSLVGICCGVVDKHGCFAYHPERSLSKLKHQK